MLYIIYPRVRRSTKTIYTPIIDLSLSQRSRCPAHPLVLVIERITIMNALIALIIRKGPSGPPT